MRYMHNDNSESVMILVHVYWHSNVLLFYACMCVCCTVPDMYRYIPLRVCTLVLPVILSSLNSATNIVHIHVCLDNNFEYFLAF